MVKLYLPQAFHSSADNKAERLQFTSPGNPGKDNFHGFPPMRGMLLSAIIRVWPSAIAAWEKITSPSESRICRVAVGLLVKAGRVILIWVHFPWWTPSFSEIRPDSFVVSARRMSKRREELSWPFFPPKSFAEERFPPLPLPGP